MTLPTPDRLQIADAGKDVGLFTWDLVSDMVYADAAVASLFGLDAGEVARGLPIVKFLDRIAPDDRPTIAKAIHEAIVTGAPYQQDYCIVRPDGSRVDVAAFGRCFRDASGSPSHYAGIVCPRIAENASQDALFWHCLQAHDLARKSGRLEMAALLAQALRSYGSEPGQIMKCH